MAVCQALSLAGWLNSDVLRGVHCSASALRLSASGTYYRSRVFRSEWRLKAVVRRKNGYLRVRLTEAAADRRPAAHSPAAPASRPAATRAELAVADSRTVAGRRAGSVNSGQNRLGTSQLGRRNQRTFAKSMRMSVGWGGRARAAETVTRNFVRICLYIIIVYQKKNPSLLVYFDSFLAK